MADMKRAMDKEKFKKVFFACVLVFGCFGVLATAVAVPVSTRISLGTMFPAMCGVVLIAYGWVKLKRKKKLIPWKVLRIIVTIIVCLGVALFVVIEGIIITYANIQPPDEDVNYCVVLGAGIFPDAILLSSSASSDAGTGNSSIPIRRSFSVLKTSC